MKLIIIILIACFQNAYAAETDEIKVLKLGEVYAFDGYFKGGKTLEAVVVCVDPNSTTSVDVGTGCGHTKHCTYMKIGESGQTAHIKFKCGQSTSTSP